MFDVHALIGLKGQNTGFVKKKKRKLLGRGF
jgi:hypothetical protein